MKIEFDERKEHLQALISELQAAVIVSERKYYHLNTLENLIFHFEGIKAEKDKNWVYETLDEYFKECFSNTLNMDREISKRLFFEYLDKITDFYHSNLGFVVLMNRGVVYFAYLVILALCYYYFNLYVVLGVVIFIALQTFKVFLKYRR